MSIRSRITVLAVVLTVATLASALTAQSSGTPPEETSSAASDVPQPKLHHEQEALRMRFIRLEQTLAKMARYLQETEPARAELIYRALARSKSERVRERMMRTTRMLNAEEGADPRFADAMAEQEAIIAELQKILTILRSEHILDANKAEQERLKELAAKINVLIDIEKSLRAKTDRDAPADRLAQEQKQTADRTGKLIENVKNHDSKAQAKQDEKQGKGGDERSGDEQKKPGDSSKKEEESGKSKEDSKSQESDEQESSQKEGQKSKGDSSQKSENNSSKGTKKPNSKGKSSQNKSSQNKPNSKQSPPSQSGKPQKQQSQSGKPSQSQQKQTPGRQQLEEARQRMEQAIKRLQKQNREEAGQEQAEAIKKLIEAKERIEEKLRQLREEERKLLLRALEARFQKMHQLQQIVLTATEELHATGRKQWKDADYARLRDAAATEREIAVEADKALEILRADGSSVAFPEAVRQLRIDIGDVAERLGQEDTGKLTILIEKDIILALEEMIRALQQEMEEMRKKKSKKSGKPQKGRPGEKHLVDSIAELKMLRTLQLRINRRTQAVGDLFEGNQASEPDIISQLQKLSRRQGRLQRATYDLAIGKTNR